MKNIIFFKDQKAFSTWLDAHHINTNEIWLGYYKKSSKHENLSWSQSVDTALRFGWIDGIRKTIDSERYKIRFTPRKLNSVWSAVNVKKVKILIQKGEMKPEGLHVFYNRKDIQGYSSEQKNIPLAKKYEALIKANQSAWLFFTDLAPSYKRDSIWWVMSAKKEATRQKRLSILISSSEAGLKIPDLRKK